MAGLVSILPLLLALIMATAASAFHAKQNPPAIFVFGGSFSDVGNNNPMPNAYHANHPHYGIDFPGSVATGRFTNGYNFIDIMVRHMGFELSPPAFVSINNSSDVLKGVNFASGGSGILGEDCMIGTDEKCITMKDQINNFGGVKVLLDLRLGVKAAKELISNSIFILTCGATDLDEFFNEQIRDLPSAPIDEFVANMNSTFRDQLKELYGLGARKFAIVNVPPLGLTPPAVALGLFLTSLTLNDYTQKFNVAEYAMLDELSSTLPGMKYSVGNAYAALSDVVSHPEILDIKNVTSPCCGEVYYPPLKIIRCTVNATLCSNRSAYVFWDAIHPTQAVIEYAGTLFYNGSAPYASPINLQQLVEYESSRGGAGIGAVEVM